MTFPVPIDSFTFPYTEINIVSIDVLHSLLGGRIDPCGRIFYPRVLPDVLLLLFGAENEDVLHPHVIVHIEPSGVCCKVVDIGLKQTSSEIGCRTVFQFTECLIQRLSKSDFVQTLHRDCIIGDVHYPESVSGGVAYFEMPDDFPCAVDAVVYRVS